MVRYGLVVASFALLFAACSSTSVVRARRLEIVDSAGRVRGVFECDEERGQRPILTLCDENSQPLMALAVGKSGDDRQKPASLFP